MTASAEGLAAAVGRILGVAPPADGDERRLREWLAGRGLGLLPVADPAAFAWPGHWIAVTRGGRAVVMYGVPSGPLDGDLGAEAIVSGFVLAAHDLNLERRADREHGVVDSIVVAAEAAGVAVTVTRCEAIPGRGLAGDRYANGAGTFSGDGARGRDLTLVDAAALDDAGLTATEARRNIVTHGIDLDVLIGRAFRIGPVSCRGERRAEPCAHLQRLTRPGVLRALVHRGGIRADVVSAGVISVGDVVELLDD